MTENDDMNGNNRWTFLQAKGMVQCGSKLGFPLENQEQNRNQLRGRSLSRVASLRDTS